MEHSLFFRPGHGGLNGQMSKSLRNRIFLSARISPPFQRHRIAGCPVSEINKENKTGETGLYALEAAQDFNLRAGTRSARPKARYSLGYCIFPLAFFFFFLFKG